MVHGVERNLDVMVDHAVVDELHHVEVVPYEVLDELTRAARYRVGPPTGVLGGTGAGKITS